MNRIIRVCNITILVLAISMAVYGMETYKQEIGAGVGYNYLKLPDEVYSSGVETVRVVDDNGNTVSYLRRSFRQEVEVEERSYSAKVIENYVEEDDEIFIFKVKTPKSNLTSDVDIRANNLTFKADRNKFAKDIVVSGSYDQINWYWVGLTTIYSVAENKNLSMYIQPSRYTYYKVRVKNNKGEIKLWKLDAHFSRVHIIFDYLKETSELKYERAEEEGKTKITIEKLNGRPLGEIRIIAEGNYDRIVSLNGVKGKIYSFDFSGVNASKESVFLNRWDSVDDVILYIENKDDVPLKIEKLMGVFYGDEIIFEGVEGTKYYLTYGDTSLKTPRYDMEKYRGLILGEDFMYAELIGDREEVLKESKKEIDDKKFSLLFNISVSTVAVLLMFLGLTTIKSSRKD